MMVFALVAQPSYGFVSSQIASAAPIADRVVINEIMAHPADGQNEWIELYNPTSADISLAGWNILFNGNQKYAIQSSSITAKGFVVVDGPDASSYISNDGETLGLEDANGNMVNSVAYSAIAQAKTYARTYDAADTFVSQATPTKNASNGLAPLAACTVTNQVHTTNLASWNQSETRATGHNELVDGGLRVWTEGSTTTDKVAGYYSTDFALSNLGDKTIAQSFDYELKSGGKPGLQMVVDFNNDNQPDGILVGETVYGNNWWLSDGSAPFAKAGAPHTGGGYGSAWYGEPNEWSAAFPQARVVAIGYSLGSGVLGDGVIKRISLGCTDYTFGLDTTAPEVPAVAMFDANGSQKYTDGYTTTENFTFKLANLSADETVKYQLKYWNSIASSGFNGAANAWTLNDMSGYSSSLGVYNDRFSQGEGTHYFSFSACDASNNCSAFTQPFAITYDKTAPTAPTNFQLFTKAGKQITNGYTNAYEVNAKWTAGSDTNSVSYDYKYWNTIDGSAYNKTEADAAYWNVGTGTANPGVFNQGEGQHYLAVRSVDAAGNTSAWTAPFSIVYDKTAPEITGSPDKDSTVAGTKVFTIHQVEANPSTMYVEYMEKDSGGIWRKMVGKEFYTNSADLSVDTTRWNDGLHQIKVSSKDKAGNSAGYSFTFNVINPQPEVLGENFNTHAGADYKGINVGFSISNFKTVSAVSVALYDADDNLLATNTHNQKLLDLISGGTTQLSTPFITTGGSYVEEYWTLGQHSISDTTKPIKAVVTVVGTGASNSSITKSVNLTPLAEPDGVTFASVLPVKSNTSQNDNPTISELPLVAPLAGFLANPGAANVFAAAVGAAQPTTDDTAVLGTQTTNENGDASDITRNVAAIAPSASGWQLFNLAWYWWLLILVAIVGAIWWIAARRQNAQ
ncbi:MAG TPA: lamin tail domain-containing protein [Candidatus Saccharimonadales bacterium]